MATRFDHDTAVRPRGGGVFETQVDPGWKIVRGPNGGYLAAILVRAMEAVVDDPERTLRSLNVHYLRPPTDGPAQVETRLERSGRSLTTVTARLCQQGELQALATAAFSRPRHSAELHHAIMPEVAPPESLPLQRSTGAAPMHARYEQRWAVGPRFFEGEQGDEAVSGGWVRLVEPRPLDAALLAAYADAWPPAIFGCALVPFPSGGVPTVDLTVHVRALPPAGAAIEDPVLVVFRTREAHEGFLEEDGEIWSRGGVLLAHSRQLALLV